jgi:hypothetical protein
MEQEINAQLAVVGNTALKYPNRPEIQNRVELRVTRGGAPNPNKQVKISIEPVKSDRELFERYYRNWKKQTGYYSDVDRIVNNENFRAIVQMKERAVPFIVEIIRERPTILVWALGMIYQKNVASDVYDIEEIGKLWLKELQV